MATRHDEEIDAAGPREEPHSIQATTGGVASGTPVADAPPTEMVADQALIEEARRRQQRRHRWIAVILVVALIGTGLGLGLSFGTGAPVTSADHRPPRFSTTPPSTSSSVALNRPEALGVASNGNVLIANQGTNQILSRRPNGTLTVVAGTGKAGYAGDGGPALRAELNDPWGMAVAANGTIYVADTRNNRVRAISPSGTITTVAGNGQAGASGVGGPAIDAAVPDPYAVALGSRGQLYIADVHGLQLVSPSGVLTTVVPSGPGRTLTINGTLLPFSPTAVAVGRSGDLYVNDLSPKLVVELTPTGQVVNSWPAYVTVGGLATAPDGSVLVGDYGFSIDGITNGQFTTLVTFRLNALAGLPGVFRPSGIAVSRTGQIYTVTDGVNGGTNRPALAAISTSAQVQLLTVGTHANH